MMTNPNFEATPWPHVPEDHPEASWTDLQRSIEPNELEGATEIHGQILDEHNVEWSKSTKKSNVRRRGIKLPLELEGTGVLSETVKNGRRILEVRKDQMDEITLWRWIGDSGEGQYWHRRYIVPGTRADDIRQEDEPLATADVSGLGYSLVMLHRLEDTLLELAQLPDNREQASKNPDLPLNPRLVRIEKAAQDPRVIKLFEDLHSMGRIDGPIREKFMSKMIDLLEQIGKEYELAPDEIIKVSEIAGANVRKQEGDDGQA